MYICLCIYLWLMHRIMIMIINMKNLKYSTTIYKNNINWYIFLGLYIWKQWKVFWIFDTQIDWKVFFFRLSYTENWLEPIFELEIFSASIFTASISYFSLTGFQGYFTAVASSARTPPSAQIPCASEWEINFWHAMKNLDPSPAETVQFSISSLIKTDINELRQQLNTISLCAGGSADAHYEEGVARKRVKHGHLSLTTNNRAESERSFYIVITVLADWLQMSARPK